MRIELIDRRGFWIILWWWDWGELHLKEKSGGDSSTYNVIPHHLDYSGTDNHRRAIIHPLWGCRLCIPSRTNQGCSSSCGSWLLLPDSSAFNSLLSRFIPFCKSASRWPNCFRRRGFCDNSRLAADIIFDLETQEAIKQGCKATHFFIHNKLTWPDNGVKRNVKFSKSI